MVVAALSVCPPGTMVPVYKALSGAVQPGPNIFWTLSCLAYARATGDFEWLRSMMPHIDALVDYLANVCCPACSLSPAFVFLIFVRGLRLTPLHVSLSKSPQRDSPRLFFMCMLSMGRRGNAYLSWLQRRDEKTGLINAPGPLMIDTFRREYFTTDVNAGVLYLFAQLHEAYELFGEKDKVWLGSLPMA